MIIDCRYGTPHAMSNIDRLLEWEAKRPRLMGNGFDFHALGERLRGAMKDMKKRVQNTTSAVVTDTNDGFIPHEPMHGVLAPVALDFEKHKRLKGVRSDLKPPPMRDENGRLLYVLPGYVLVTKVVHGNAC